MSLLRPLFFLPLFLIAAGAIPTRAVWADGGGIPRLSAEESLSPSEQKERIRKWCDDTRTAIRQFRWKIDPCTGPKGPVNWRIGGTSVEGHPLLFAEFGDPAAPNTTLILSAVHGDEITPLYLGIQAAHWMIEHQGEFSKSRVVVAPMINPDGFFRKPRTRTNGHGVDINRNFPTRDWSSEALEDWKRKERSDPRRYPGPTARSEPETLFQEDLIRLGHPQKILTIHSPLNHLDYDGPMAGITLSKFPRDYVKKCLELRVRLKAVSTGFFPGSLGNYAGRELGIPTLTLELPTADPGKARAYWNNFTKGIRTMIGFQLSSYVSVQRARGSAD